MSLYIGLVTMDCRDPQELSRFWALALEIEVQGDYGDFVMLGSPAPRSAWVCSGPRATRRQEPAAR